MIYALSILYFIYTITKIVISLAEIGFIKQKREKKAIILTPTNYQKAADYKMVNEELNIVSSLFDFVVAIFWIFGGLSFLEGFIVHENSLSENILFVLIFIVINYILSLPFDIFNTFVKDKRFGFSTIDVKTYLLDQIKGGLIFLVAGSLVIGVISWIVMNLPFWWVWGFVVIMTVLVVINLIYPTIIAPLFNKFNPLADESLKSSIESLLKKAGLHSSGVFTIDASKRDKRLNAFFGGLGKSKRVVLYDTLIEKLGKSELLAVLGHELGHFKHKDIVKKIALMGGVLFAIFAIFGNIPTSIYEALHVKVEAYSIVSIFLLFSPILFFIVTPIIGIASRHDEYKADEYGSECESQEALSSALMKLADENKSFPYSHPLSIFFYHTHPPLVERLYALGVDVEA